MPVPSRKELLDWAANYVALWNAGDKEAWIANWKKVAPGEVIIEQGDENADNFYIVDSGEFDCFVEGVNDGKDFIVVRRALGMERDSNPRPS